MSKPSAIGVQGAKVVFSIGGRSYVTGAISAAAAGTLSVKEAERLIATGQAQPADNNYLAQFPWTTPPK